jgi:hypothetical protein
MVDKVGKCVCTVLALTNDLWSSGCYCKFVMVVSSPKWNLKMPKFVDRLLWIIFHDFAQYLLADAGIITKCFLSHPFWFVIHVIILPLLFWCGLCCNYASLSYINAKTCGSLYDVYGNDVLMMQWSLLSHPFCLMVFHWSDTFFWSVFIPFCC